MKNKIVKLSEIVSKDPATTVEAFDSARSGNPIPPLISEIAPNKFLLIDSLAKLSASYDKDRNEINCILIPPVYFSRPVGSYYKISKQALCNPIDDYKAVQREKYQASHRYEAIPQIKTNRGTMVKIYLDVDFGGSIIRFFVNPLEHGVGGLLFNPTEALNRFIPNSVNATRIAKSWGDEVGYRPETLPSVICLSEDGQYCFGVASRLDKQHMYHKVAVTSADLELSSKDLPPKEQQIRGVVKACSVLVLYPNGSTYEGTAKVTEHSVLMLWSEKLISSLINPDWSEGYFEREWWNNPTSLIVNDAVKPMCTRIEHTCNDCAILK